MSNWTFQSATPVVGTVRLVFKPEGKTRNGITDLSLHLSMADAKKLAEEVAKLTGAARPG